MQSRWSYLQCSNVLQKDFNLPLVPSCSRYFDLRPWSFYFKLVLIIKEAMMHVKGTSHFLVVGKRRDLGEVVS